MIIVINRLFSEKTSDVIDQVHVNLHQHQSPTANPPQDSLPVNLKKKMYKVRQAVYTVNFSFLSIIWN